MLRPREGVYGVIALILGLSVLNTAFVAFVWFEVSALRERDAAPATLQPGAIAGLVPEAFEQALPIHDRAPAAVAILPDTPGVPSEAAPEQSVVPAPPQPPGAFVAPIATPAPAESLRLAIPRALDGLLLAMLIEDLPAERGDREAVLLAAALWGSGYIAAEARRVAAADDLATKLLAVAAIESARGGTDGNGGNAAQEPPRSEIVLAPGVDAALAEACAALAGEWESRWTRLAQATPASDEAARFADRARAHLAVEVDRLLLIDLTESMAGEAAITIAALRRIVPLALAARGKQRWGWIGYRDDVTDTFPLTADGNEFLASLERWECQEGGDVPEGVDRALFEALRFGSFAWRPTARHELWIIGDAPPPYDRIAPMLSLVRSAHESPERFRVNCLGVIREPDFPRVPSFAELADATGGIARFVAPGEEIRGAWWELACGRAPQVER